MPFSWDLRFQANMRLVPICNIVFACNGLQIVNNNRFQRIQEKLMRNSRRSKAREIFDIDTLSSPSSIYLLSACQVQFLCSAFPSFHSSTFYATLVNKKKPNLDGLETFSRNREYNIVRSLNASHLLYFYLEAPCGSLWGEAFLSMGPSCQVRFPWLVCCETWMTSWWNKRHWKIFLIGKQVLLFYCSNPRFNLDLKVF